MKVNIYTSYFGNLKNIPKNIIPVSICLKVPKEYKGIQYKKLAPTYDILSHYKETGDKTAYVLKYNKEIIKKLNAKDVVDDLLCMTGLKQGVDERKNGIVLLCYETPEDFCHRHLIADWLNANGYDVVEY